MAPKRPTKSRYRNMTEMGEKKSTFYGGDFSSDSNNVPPGFASVPIAYARKRSVPLRSFPATPAKRVIRNSGEAVGKSTPAELVPTATCCSGGHQSVMSSPNSPGNDSASVTKGSMKNAAVALATQSPAPDHSGKHSSKPAGQELEPTDSNVVLTLDNNSEQARHQAEPVGRRSNRLANLSHSSNSNSSKASAKMRKQAARSLPDPENSDCGISTAQKSPNVPIVNQLVSSNYSTANKATEPAPVLPNAEEGGNGTQTVFPGQTNKNLGGAYNFTLTEMVLLGDGGCSEDEVEFPTGVTVLGCRLKEEFALTAKYIENKHGDILANVSLEGTLRSLLFETVCAIYQKLEKTAFTDITLPELEMMRKDVRDLSRVNVEVGWLVERLDDIHHGKQLVARIMDQRKENQQRESELEEEVNVLQLKLREAKEKLKVEKKQPAIIRQKFTQAKDIVRRFFKKSLVEGI